MTLPRLLAQRGLEYAVKDDVVIISSPRRIDEERKETATMAGDHSPAPETVPAKMGEPIPMPFAREVRLDFALRTIEQATRDRHPGGIPIRVDAVGLEEVDRSLGSHILMDVEGVSLETTLRLLSKPAGLACIVKDGLVIVGSVKLLQQFQGTSGNGPRSPASSKGLARLAGITTRVDRSLSGFPLSSAGFSTKI